MCEICFFSTTIFSGRHGRDRSGTDRRLGNRAEPGGKTGAEQRAAERPRGQRDAETVGGLVFRRLCVFI